MLLISNQWQDKHKPFTPSLTPIWGEGNKLKGVLLTEATEGSCGATAWHLFETDTSSAELAGICDPLAWNNHPRTDIITSPAETAGLWSDLKRHAHFSAHSSSNKSEGLSIHLFVAHPNTKAAENTTIVLHGKSDFEKTHACRDFLSHLHIGSTGD